MTTTRLSMNEILGWACFKGSFTGQVKERHGCLTNLLLPIELVRLNEELSRKRYYYFKTTNSMFSSGGFATGCPDPSCPGAWEEQLELERTMSEVELHG
jgi:hypothetical protein